MFGKEPLVLLSPFVPKVPTDVNHPVSPMIVDEGAVARQKSAAALVAQQAARLDPRLLARIEALSAQHTTNIQARRAAQEERVEAARPLPDDADLASVAARAHLIADLDRYIGVLEARVAESGRAFTDAVAEVRSDLYYVAESAGGVLRQIRDSERQTQTHIADLEQQAGELALLRMGVESGLKAWKPDAPPVEPAPKKRRLGRA